jgi:hypothetical protein
VTREIFIRMGVPRGPMVNHPERDLFSIAPLSGPSHPADKRGRWLRFLSTATGRTGRAMKFRLFLPWLVRYRRITLPWL